MCGISGICGEYIHENAIVSMAESLQHRGPDYTGYWRGNQVALAHNRLSIIDLSKSARQPMISRSGRYVVVYNGEIYNYVELKSQLQKNYTFTTESDTEVLLAAYEIWQEKMLEKLIGMFSFAIWDNYEKKLFAARDRFGVKPFYYAEKGKQFYFASEIKALWSAGFSKNPDETVWSTYFQFGSYGMPDETFWHGIKQLPGGHFLIWKNGKIHIRRWYDFIEKQNSIKVGLSYEEVKKHYQEILEQSIQLRFRSDVPVGINLSGGLDSSVLLAFVNKLHNGKNIEAYTFITGDKRYDELPWVKEMIRLTNNPLHVVPLHIKEALRKIEEMTYYQDEPYGGLPTIAYGKIFEVARKDGTYVLLDGQGMDEQWAGYDYYTRTSGYIIQGVKKSPFRPSVLKKDFREMAQKPNYPAPFKSQIKNLQFRDLFYTKIPRAVRFNDRASMKSSVELREPFLDHRLVEWAFAQPEEFKIRNGIRKYLLRDLVSRHLSDKITFAPKRPLQTPQREWLAEEFTSWVEKRLHSLSDNPVTRTWFDQEKLLIEWNLYKNGVRDSSFHIWQWLNTALIFNNQSC